MKLMKIYEIVIEAAPKSYRPPKDFAQVEVNNVQNLIKADKIELIDEIEEVNVTIRFYKDKNFIYWLASVSGEDVGAGRFMLYGDGRVPDFYMSKSSGAVISGYGLEEKVLKYMHKHYHLLSDRVISKPIRHIWKKVFGKKLQTLPDYITTEPDDNWNYPDEFGWFVSKMGTDVDAVEIIKKSLGK